MSQSHPLPMPGAEAPVRRMTRPTHGRWIAGVCAGLAEHLGLPVVWVRAAMVLLAVGPAWIGYPMLWALTEQARADSQRIDPAAAPAAAPVEQEQRWVRWLVIIGAVLAVAGIIPALAGNGLPRASLLIPMVALGMIAVLGLSNADAVQRDRWLGRQSGWPAVARFAAGGVAIVIGSVVVVSRSDTLAAASDIAAASVVVVLGMTFLLAPWALRLWREAGAAHAARARADERADIAAHLHDSVLQTLALIQRQASDSARVATLARIQERELRGYLYGAATGAQLTLSGALSAVIDEVEMAHGIPIDVVVTGEAEMDDHVGALVRAIREALINAVRHGAPPVALYVEVGPEEIEAFVRDHGPGIDLDAIPQDRLGVRESIMGRMARAGGEASLRSREPGGEWCLRLPVTPQSTTASQPTSEGRRV